MFDFNKKILAGIELTIKVRKVYINAC